MIRSIKFLFCILLGFWISACSLFRSQKKDPSAEKVGKGKDFSMGFKETEVEEVGKNEESSASSCCLDYRRYRASRSRDVDLLHTRLYVSFDWEKRYLYGKADLILKPYFYPVDSVHLDAKGFLIHRVGFIQGSDTIPLPYRYDSLQIHIALMRPFSRHDTIRLFIHYTARPEELSFEGSAAIMERKGLYFINPDGKDPDKPRQIWTQGETESSSCWFPTIDSPNERTTQEIWITVDSELVTLSNGILVASQYHRDGTRTDYWRMDLPHAPYLFMMAVGPFVKVTDQWNGKEVSYYVEPQYAPYARAIFGRTPEMIQFFSDYLQVPFPWPKYAQVVVRDFVSGAMENTTATVHMEALQRTDRELLDQNYEEFIAHELFHHWFGDYVTCESWAHITLNEGFATYGEYLWKEYKEGKWAADHHLEEDLATYLLESTNSIPLIRYEYQDREEVFDAHSYQKGALVLHMLRHFVGEEAFREALRLYLTKNAFQSVELAHLRLAFEEVTGKDLRWFFDQWYFRPGHPKLRIRVDSLAPNHVRVSIVQTQSTPAPKIYFLPTEVVLYTKSRTYRYPVFLQSRDTLFTYTLSEPILNVDVDPNYVLLAVREVEKPLSYWKQQLKKGESYGQLTEAINQLTPYLTEDKEIENDFLQLLFHPYHGIRSRIIAEFTTSYRLLGGSQDSLYPIPEPIFHAFLKVAEEDPVRPVKALALDALVFQEVIDHPEHPWRAKLIPVFEKHVLDSSYQVSASALNGLYLYAKAKALHYLPELMKNARNELFYTIVDILIAEKDTTLIDFLRQNRSELSDPFMSISVYQTIVEMVKDGSSEAFRQKTIAFLKEQATQSGSWWKRYFPFHALKQLEEIPEVKEFIETELSKPENQKIRKRIRLDQE